MIVFIRWTTIKCWTITSDAENVFVSNTSRVVAALEARAKAEAAQQALVDTYKKYYQQKNRHDTSTGDFYYKVKTGDKINQDEAKAAGLGKGDGSGWSSYTLTKQGAAKVNAYRSKQAVQKKNQRNNKLDTDLKKDTDFYTDIIVDNTAIANKTLKGGKHTSKHTGKGGGHTPKTTPKTDKTEVFDPSSLKGLEQHLSKLQEEQGKLRISQVFQHPCARNHPVHRCGKTGIHHQHGSRGICRCPARRSTALAAPGTASCPVRILLLCVPSCISPRK